jgi:Ca-activated chloride channel homolog
MQPSTNDRNHSPARQRGARQSGLTSRLPAAVMLLALLGGGTAARGQAVLIGQPSDAEAGSWRLPRPPHWPPPPQPPRPRPPQPPAGLYRVKNLEIDARIIDGVAHIAITQRFVNDGPRIVEARAIMPLPPEVVVQQMTFLVDGQEIAGQLFTAEEARRIYQGYLQRGQDPALIQWLGSGLLQTNVFPIPPGAERTVQLSLVQLPRRTGGMIDWLMPLKAAGYSSQVLEHVKLTLHLQQSTGLGNIYSPTHPIQIERIGSTQATVRYSRELTAPETDFRVLVDTARGPLSASWLGFQSPEQAEPFFGLWLYPQFDVPADRSAKDVVMVLDTSGSMRGEKMEQARDALLYVLEHLPDSDHFGLVTFDTHVAKFRDQLVSAEDAGGKQQAVAFVRAAAASGMTHIEQALEAAFDLLKDRPQPGYIIFLTDGQPTVGQRDDRLLAAQAAGRNNAGHRIFSFGVGHDVNARLLDRLSRECFGQTFFVAAEENIERSVSSLYDRLGQPALSDIRWELTDASGQSILTQDVHPKRVYDLFSGDSLALLGRYRLPTDVAILDRPATLTITGRLASEPYRLEVPLDIRPSSSRLAAGFLPPLWAGRQAAAIIDEIDLEGRRQELIDQLIALAQKYGVMTEYTAFLAEEPGGLRPEMASQLRERVASNLRELETVTGGRGFAQRQLKGRLGEVDNVADAESLQRGDAGGGSLGVAPRPLGAARPAAPGAAAAPARGESGDPAPATRLPRRNADKVLYFQEDAWVESGLTADQIRQAKSIERFSSEFFQLLEQHQETLGQLIQDETPIIVQIDTQVYRI